MTRATVRLTMAQALVRYLCNQFTVVDDEKVPGPRGRIHRDGDRPPLPDGRGGA